LLRESTRAKAFGGIGVSAAGCIYTVNGRVSENGGNVPGWSFTSVTGPLMARYGIPAKIANDGNCAVLGEIWTGAARGCTDVICITLGTGVGGGIVSGGRLVRGARGFAGEIGHIPIHAGEGEICSCGRRGCFETFASTSALVRKAEKICPEWTSGRHVFEAVYEGNEEAEKLVSGWIDEIAYGITGLIHTLNPEMVLIGGGVSAQEETVVKPIREKVMEMEIPDFIDGLKIETASLENDAGIVGAVKNLIDHLKNQ
jgi:glucokinase